MHRRSFGLVFRVARFASLILVPVGLLVGAVAATARVGPSCQLTAAPPTVANDKISGSGTVRCKTSRTVHVHIETQVQEMGQWGTFSSLDTDVRVKAAKTHRVRIRPANCMGMPNTPMRTVLSEVKFPRRVLTATSSTVEIGCP